MTDERDIVIARYTRVTILLLLLAVCLAALLVWWCAAAPRPLLLLLGSGCLAYFLWRLGAVLYVSAFEGARALYIRDGVLHGLLMGTVSIEDLSGVSLRVNEVGRAVLTLARRSGKPMRVAVSGMNPSPLEIERRFAALLRDPSA